jgi:hypothetical protein
MNNDICRNTRSKSISPKVSLDKIEYEDQEKLEKDKFGAPIDELCREITECVDDLYKYVNSKLFDFILDYVKEEQNIVMEVYFLIT